MTTADSAVGITAGANNGNQDATTTNGHTFIKEIQVECNGMTVYNNMRATQLHPNIKTNILIRLEDDNNIIFRKGAAPDSKVIVTKLRLWCPKIIFNGLRMKEYTEKYLIPKKWTYLREHHEISQTTAVNSYFRISTGIRRPRHVLLWVVPTANYNSQEHNIFTFDTFSIGANNRYFSKAQLEVNNSIYYPQLEMTTDEESRLYRALMSFSSGYNDFLSGLLIDRANFKNLFGIYFDLRNQAEDVKDSVVSLTFRYELNGANPTNYTLNALVLHEKEIKLYTSSGKLLIKA